MIGGYFGGRVDAVIMYLITRKAFAPGSILSARSLVSVFGSSPVALEASDRVPVLGSLRHRHRIVTQQLQANVNS